VKPATIAAKPASDCASQVESYIINSIVVKENERRRYRMEAVEKSTRRRGSTCVTRSPSACVVGNTSRRTDDELAQFGGRCVPRPPDAQPTAGLVADTSSLTVGISGGTS
jgi:hypothetical protein